MIMPFIRLVAIYFVVILAIVAFFKRDQLMELTGMSFAQAEPAQVEGSKPAAIDTPVQAILVDPVVVEVAQTAESKPTATAQSGQTAIVTPTANPSASSGAATDSQQAALQTPVLQSPVADAPIAPKPRPAQLPIVQPTPDQPAPAQTAQVKPAPTTAAKPTPTAAPTQAVQVKPVDVQARLTQARQAYWSGDLAKSETLYLALARDVPTNADVNGELGNLYYARRNYAKAADAYLATGKLLVANGNGRQIMPLISVLQSIAPDKAAALGALATN